MTLEDGVRAAGLLAPGRPVLVLFSGGRDSSCLLDLAARIAGPGSVRALHVNYGLRETAGRDEQMCAATCERLGVALEVRRVPWPGTGNVQAWAREVRYSAASRLAGEDDVAAGHTASDQVETILYRLASSPSRRALLGMRPRDGHLVRPLLQYTRAETTAYCRERGLEWAEDETNAEGVYARGRVRERLVPALREIHPAAEANVLAVAAVLREEAEVLDELVDRAIAGADAIPLRTLRALPTALQRLVIQRLADGVHGRPAPGAGRRATEVAALSDRGTAFLDLPHGVRAMAADGALRFVATPSLID